jgi:hypothetical protein
MLKYYNGSLVKALVQLFPNVHFETQKFIGVQGVSLTLSSLLSLLSSPLSWFFPFFSTSFRSFFLFSLFVNKNTELPWHAKESERKNFFVEFAESKRFDPNVPENWYPVTQSDVFSFQVPPSLFSLSPSLLYFNIS